MSVTPQKTSYNYPFLKAVSAPYRHTELRIIPLGGINSMNMNAYLDLTIVPAFGGSWLASNGFTTPANVKQDL